MKILSVDKIRDADAYTIKHEPISSLDLMERASEKLFMWVCEHVDNKKSIEIFVGLGNNGGDGLALGRMLMNEGYEVSINVLRYSDNITDDFQINYDRLLDLDKHVVKNISSLDEFNAVDENTVIIDAIFGSGLSRPVIGFTGKIINEINKSKSIVIAIDIPSGLFSDVTSKNNGGAIINADYTLSFQFPKIAFLVPENDLHVGQWNILDIGLHHDFINSTITSNHYVINEDVVHTLKTRPKFSHKGTFGHALIIAGSFGKMGAAILCSRACLKSGVGLLHTHIPRSGITALQSSTPETMLSIDNDENYFSEVPDLNSFNAIAIGPGIGQNEQTLKALKLLIQNSNSPMVLDADALNILSNNPTWLAFLPQSSILTPHPKEFERIVGGWNNDFECLDKQKALAQKHSIYVVLKGANTSICFPDGQIFFNSTGNPGMATAGSGDVLTGIITGLLASGYSPAVSSVMGVYLHGLAGDLSAVENGMEATTAGDIIENLGKAFLDLKS
ncbi:MAG: NAD(P)H-hydrate dehydratase [Lentimicrobiaceae bacterium]|jgi:NAD(P)H-hydrate epimerase|nr:NAD(P)H-hydrate dehydratase [Lentimicrobiaceae bacterium]MBT3455033.1 NAD(P)H-hydrate dehydratase [Lentimicrobiaceae bacterium]MBT3818676.1 NAD(P)H-hydrate dehydratase [Lentimicrobiaceae bacterium]MBT4060407.1 NAD(P)H-hydrate dehydratase [Lentimicrobiaceae bacterium]MBT4191621.1 NAD(P)H-hydrate dehydratase [Lentimicrobiaceae bacterium]